LQLRKYRKFPEVVREGHPALEPPTGEATPATGGERNRRQEMRARRTKSNPRENFIT